MYIEGYSTSRSQSRSAVAVQNFMRALPGLMLSVVAFAQSAPPANGGPPGMPVQPEVDRSKDCDRQCLRSYADKYLAAFAAHDPSTLEVTPTLRVGENSHAIILGENTWKTVVRILPEKVYFTDPYAGQVLVIGTLEMRAAEPFIYAVRLKLEKGKLSESETMVTSDKIAGQHFRPDLMGATSAPLNATLPASERLTRAELLKAARIIWGADAGTPLPASKSCMHYENWESPLGGTPCMTGGGDGRLRSARNLRMPLVDVEKGVAVNFQLQDAADTQPRDPPPGEVNGKTPVFYYRPLTFNVMQLAKVSSREYLMDAMFMNLQELGAPVVFRH